MNSGVLGFNPTREIEEQKHNLLGGSWVAISGVITGVTIVITQIRGLIIPLISTHEPPSRGSQHTFVSCNEIHAPAGELHVEEACLHMYTGKQAGRSVGRQVGGEGRLPGLLGETTYPDPES